MMEQVTKEEISVPSQNNISLLNFSIKLEETINVHLEKFQHRRDEVANLVEIERYLCKGKSKAMF